MLGQGKSNVTWPTWKHILPLFTFIRIQNNNPALWKLVKWIALRR